MALDELPSMKQQRAREEELGAAREAKLPRARRQRNQPQDEDSILFRSAESIGRLIGTLQRQLDTARNQIASFGNNDGNGGSPTRQNNRHKSNGPASKAKGSTRVSRTGTVGRRKTTSKSASTSGAARTAAAGKRKNATAHTKATRARKSR